MKAPFASAGGRQSSSVRKLHGIPAIFDRFHKSLGFGAWPRLCVVLFACVSLARGAEWQWSVPVGDGRAFLWIPPACAHVRAVMVGQHNMIEQGIFEDPLMRSTLEELDIAEVWIAPTMDFAFDFHSGAGERFDRIMKAVADVSGYEELAAAPVIPIGHSACATFPWNFAAWSPGRTLAVLSIHGDAPQTNMTGYGKQNVEWGDRSIDGVPGLMVMAEYEWLEGRLAPAIAFRKRHPDAPIALLAEPGRGHFDTTPDLIRFLVMFIRKAANARLPGDGLSGLRPVSAKDGWLVERWHLDQPRQVPAAPAAMYSGDRAQAFWAFDEEMAKVTQDYRSNQVGRKPQLLGFVQGGGVVPQTATHQQVNLKFEPMGDAMRFHLEATFLASVDGGSPNPARWTGLPPGSPLGHADGGGPIGISLITGPARQVGPGEFEVALNRTASTVDRRADDVWFLAEQAGDAVFKSAVQQALMRIRHNRGGAEQHIRFAVPENVVADRRGGVINPIRLDASSDSGLPVHFYVREGPAEIEGDQLRFTALPPRSKFPIAVTVVAWQLGRAATPEVREAQPVERSFFVLKGSSASEASFSSAGSEVQSVSVATTVVPVSDTQPVPRAAQDGTASHSAADRVPGSGIVDSVSFGNAASEAEHQLVAVRSEVVVGGLGEPARRLLPNLLPAWQGGSVRFFLKVDPERPNYATVRLWGSDVTSECLTLFCDGRQIGYRHEGDVDILDKGGEGVGPSCANRFFYITCPLPLEMTRGKIRLPLEIRGSGGMWPYGGTFATFQHSMSEPSRGIYALYVHTDGTFTPPGDERQGHAPVNPPVRTSPGLEEMKLLAQRVDGEVRRIMASPAAANQMQNQFLARAWLEPWTSAYQNPKALQKIVQSLDNTYAAYVRNPHLAASDPATPNADWFGLGPSGDVLRLVGAALGANLSEQIDDRRGGRILRSEALARMLVDCRDWHRRHRRLYSNQTMINDLYGIYLANRGLEVVAPEKALPEPEVRRYLYESVGLEPWRNSDPGAQEGPLETGGKPWPVAPGYWQLTRKGLTRELGYVGYYGEVLDWMTSIYNATRPEPGRPGDERIRQQLVRVEKARSYFRYPEVDNDGNRAMRIETIVGWRDPNHYPGDVCYGERMTWDGSALYCAASTMDPNGVGYARQMLGDNQFFAMLRDRMVDRGFRVTAGLLDVPSDYARILAAPPSSLRLPMTPGQPDFVFSDEEDGVVAIKDGDHIFYASLYWRAHRGVNFLARVHDIGPQYDRIAVVREEAVVDESGMTYVRPDTFVTPAGGPHYPDVIHSAEAGERLPIARIPEGVAFKAGDESIYAGRAVFYTLRYGRYLIGLNMDEHRIFQLATPGGQKPVAPGTTVVVKLSEGRDP